MNKYIVLGISTTDGGVQKFSMDVMPDEVLKGINIAQNAAEVASNATTTAETAQSTANTAKSTAEAAKSTANTAKTTAETAYSEALSMKDRNYYLARHILDRYFAESIRNTETLAITFPTSELQYPSDCTALFKNKYPVVGRDYTFTWDDGTSCTATYTGNTLNFYKLSASQIETTIYYSQAAHQYCFKGTKGTLAGDFCSKIEVDLLPYISFNDIILMSSTTNSIKRFKITVDDTGVLSVTEC